MKFTLAIFICGFSIGCALLRPRVGSTNFRDNIEIQQTPEVFYSGEQRIDGTSTYDIRGKLLDKSRYDDCFPPFKNTSCTYDPIAQLDMKSFKIRLSDNYNSLDLKEAKDFLYLTAAETTSQYGYKYFIVYEMHDNNFCGSSQTANTYGTISGNRYSGTTWLSTDVSCIGEMKLAFLSFHDYEVIKNGVFFRDNWFKPFMALYEKYPQGRNFNRNSIREPWKSYYDANETAQVLREQYQIKTKSDYLVSVPQRPDIPLLDKLKKSD
jgi:hypothetical protein